MRRMDKKGLIRLIGTFNCYDSFNRKLIHLANKIHQNQINHKTIKKKQQTKLNSNKSKHLIHRKCTKIYMSYNDFSSHGIMLDIILNQICLLLELYLTLLMNDNNSSLFTCIQFKQRFSYLWQRFACFQEIIRV